MDHDTDLLLTMSAEDMAALLPIIRIAFPSFRHYLTPSSRHSVIDRCRLSCSEDVEGFISREQLGNRILPYPERNVDGLGSSCKNVASSTADLYHQYYSDERLLTVTLDSNVCEDTQQQNDNLKEFRTALDAGYGSSFLTPRTSTCKDEDQRHLYLHEELRSLPLLSAEHYGELNSNVDGYLIRPLDDQFSFLIPPTSHFQSSQYMDEQKECCSDDGDFSEGDANIDNCNSNDNEDGDDDDDDDDDDDEYCVSYDHHNDTSAIRYPFDSTYHSDWHDDEPYFTTPSVDCHLYFPKINRRKRKVVKTSVGWVKNRLSSVIFGSRVRHKRKCSLPCCTGCETEVMKKRRISLSTLGSKKCDKKDCKLGLNLTIEQMQEKSSNGKRYMRTRKLSEDNQCSANRSPANMQRGAPRSDGEFASSYLTAAVITILLNAGSQGLTGNETARRLEKQGLSKAILGFNDQSDLVDEVKKALRECPAIRELKNHRFVLRDHCLYMNVKRINEGDTRPKDNHETARIDIGRGENHCQEMSHNSGVCSSTGRMRCSENQGGCIAKRPKLGDIKNRGSSKEDSDIAGVGSCSEKSMEEDVEEVAQSRCCRTDGKHWQCTNQAMAGSVYCKHHDKRRHKKKYSE